MSRSGRAQKLSKFRSPGKAASGDGRRSADGALLGSVGLLKIIKIYRQCLGLGMS